MKQLLWVSPYVPYDTVSHAGGQNHNYYVKYFQKHGEFDIHLVTLAEKNQFECIDLDQYKISYDVDVVNATRLKDLFRKLYNLNSAYNPYHKLCGMIFSYQYRALRKGILRYAQTYTPEIVILQWTGAAFLLPEIRDRFPEAYVVLIEEDVSFLGYERRYRSEGNSFLKWKWRKRAQRLKEKELDLILRSDLTVVNNPKDYALLNRNGIWKDKLMVIAPYFHDYSKIERKHIRPMVLFFGLMSRWENQEAALWFIRNVMPLLADTELNFAVIGGNPSDELRACEGDRVKVYGYVEDVSPWFAEALCMVVPLHLGAGIKIKVLEAMSAGMPVLSSGIGREGIPAENENEIYYCETPQEYDKIIRLLYRSKEERVRVSDAAKDFIQRTYDTNRQLEELIDRLLQIPEVGYD